MSWMLWGVPVWVWIVFFMAKIFWVAAGGIVWYFFFDKALWNERIAQKYLGDLFQETEAEENTGLKVSKQVLKN